MDLFGLTVSQLTTGFLIAAPIALFVKLIADTRKPRPISGETYLYIKPSDDDFFDMITEFRNDISGK